VAWLNGWCASAATVALAAGESVDEIPDLLGSAAKLRGQAFSSHVAYRARVAGAEGRSRVAQNPLLMNSSVEVAIRTAMSLPPAQPPPRPRPPCAKRCAPRDRDSVRAHQPWRWRSRHRLSVQLGHDWMAHTAEAWKRAGSSLVEIATTSHTRGDRPPASGPGRLDTILALAVVWRNPPPIATPGSGQEANACPSSFGAATTSSLLTVW
jgi:hypothetical protein